VIRDVPICQEKVDLPQMDTEKTESAWTKPRIAALLKRLEARNGLPPAIPRFNPMEELVSCILSQHTSDANSFPAFHRLRAKYPTWEDVAQASEANVAEVIRNAGLANQKSRSMLGVLKRIKELNDDYLIDNLARMPPQEARKWLEQLPGVGPKTASIVLCFSFGMDVIPVDTHVFRVSWRLGLIQKEIGEAKAHDALQPLIPKGLSYRLHMGMISHGRQVCRAPKPKCGECHLTDLCGYFKNVVRPGMADTEQKQERSL
jgi:endonuclease III